MTTRRLPRPSIALDDPDHPHPDADWRIDELTKRRALTGIALARAALAEARLANARARGEFDDENQVSTAA